MRYQDSIQEKGLFTFYREQAEFEDKIKKKKNKRNSLNDVPQAQSTPKQRNKFMQEPEKEIITKRKQTEVVFGQNDGEIMPIHKRQAFRKQFGDSVLVINRQKTLENAEQKNKQGQDFAFPGHYLKNKNISFDSLSLKCQDQVNNQFSFRKKSANIRLNFYNRFYELSKEGTAQKDHLHSDQEHLPALNVQQGQNRGQYIIPRRYKSKVAETALREGSSGLIRQIRGKIIEDSLDDLYRRRVNHSVSFIQYNRPAKNDFEDARDVDKLNVKQRRILELLQKYKKKD